ncbi:MAG TPA: efflux RND transporter periplasmic adaptor subunit [Pirellulales bacterium]|jgi:RND family efflux transporter MFP subunit|nr:efflux RND transporter periplasmic adaptor subunit [Pirellulales bacterium]
MKPMRASFQVFETAGMICRRWGRALSAACVVATCLWAAGCDQPAPALPPATNPEVEVCLPTYRQVTDREEFTGQTEAVKTIDIRARVTGYLKSVNFRHGAEVKKGDLLFEIDPPYYEAETERAAGVAAEAEAKLRRLRLDYERAEKLRPNGIITKEQFDLVAGDLAQAEATLRAALGSLKIAQVNLGYCEVRAPIDGRMSRPNIDPGNLAKADDTILTRIVSQDPIWVYFDLDERTMLRLRRLVHKGTLGVADTAAAKVPVLIGLADEQGYSHQGVLDFEDNRLDPSTGTLRVRAVFDNRDRLLTAGLFVRVRLPIGEPHQALLVPEQALGTDQGQKFLYVVTAQDEIAYRPVEVGKVHDRQRVIIQGLAADERVVVTGLQRVRPGIKVKPTMVAPAATADTRATSQAK